MSKNPPEEGLQGSEAPVAQQQEASPNLPPGRDAKDTLPVSAHAQTPTRSSSPGLSKEVDDNSQIGNTIADEKANAVEIDVAGATLAPKPKSWVFWCALSAILAGAFLYGLDTTIAADVQASIYESLHEVSKIAWVGIGFPLGSAGTILPIGMAYTKFNQKTLLCAGLVIFEAGSALCGGAPTMNALIWGRVIAGVGGCAMYLGGLNFVTVYTTIKERSVYTALLGMVWAIGTIVGPVIGGGFASSSATWRWAFYINVCLFAVIGPILFFIMPPHDPRPDLSMKAKFAKMDWIGALLIAVIFTTFILAFSLGGSQWQWNDGRWIAMIVVFGISLIAFVVQQALQLFTNQEEQIVPVWFLKRRTMVYLYITMACTSSAFFMAVYYIPLYFQFAHADSPIRAAVRLLPFICVAVFFMMLQGAMLPVLGYYYPWYILSGIFILIGGSVMYTVDPDTAIFRVYGYSIFIAIGCGLSAQGGYALAAAKARNAHEMSHSINYMNIAQIGSVALALCISGQIFQSVGYTHLSHALAGDNFTPQQIRDAIAGTKSAVIQNGGERVQVAAVAAVTRAIDMVYIQAIGCGAAVLVVGAGLMKREKLDFHHVAAG